MPGTILSTPAGKPASVHRAANSITEMGASSEGFSTTLLPAAMAGAIFLMAISSGWFQGGQ
jgi:hypothetical protein